MTQSTDRLDRIEEIVQSLAVNQTSLQQTVQQLTTKVDTVTTQVETLTTKVDTVTTQVETLATKVDTVTAQIERLTTQVEIVTNDIGTLTGVMADSIVEAESDREIMRQNQAEIRRIWEYLLGQQPGNGKSGNE